VKRENEKSIKILEGVKGTVRLTSPLFGDADLSQTNRPFDLSLNFFVQKLAKTNKW